MVETGVGLAVDLAKAPRFEIAEIVGEGDADAEGQSGSAGCEGVALGLREETAGDAVTTEIRVHSKAAEVQALALSGGKDAAGEATIRRRDDDYVIGERRRDRLGGLAERAGLRLELAAVFLEGGTDEAGDRRALRGCGEADRDLARGGAQMPVCSGRWSSATKLLNLVVSPSKRSITLLMGPWRCLATMISALP